MSMDEVRIQIEAIKHGISHAEKSFKEIGDIGDPIRFKLIAQFAASSAIDFYINEKRKNQNEQKTLHRLPE